MQGALLAAAIHPDNTPHGYNLTFAFPMLMFIIVAGVLYLRFRGPHRVPGHISLESSRWAGSQPVPPQAAGVAQAAGLTPAAVTTETVSVDKAAEQETVTAEQPESAPESTEEG